MRAEAPDFEGFQLPRDVEGNRQLVADLRARDPIAERRFWNHLPQILERRVSRYKTGDPQDLIGETIFSLWRTIEEDKYDPNRASLLTFAHAIMHNIYVNQVRRVGARARVENRYNRTLEQDNRHTSAEDDFVAWEEQMGLRRDLHTAFQQTLGKGRSYVLRNFLGESARQIAESEGIPVGTVKTRIRRAKQILKKTLAPAEI